jgi:hypothetical protein
MEGHINEIIESIIIENLDQFPMHKVEIQGSTNDDKPRVFPTFIVPFGHDKNEMAQASTHSL